MVLLRPGLRLNARGVGFLLAYRDLDRYSTNEVQLFTREATRIHNKCELKTMYTHIAQATAFKHQYSLGYHR
jgi:hypothetical protein